MYAEALLGVDTGVPTPMIPQQNADDPTVVYLVYPKEPGAFAEPEVRRGMTTGNQVSVLARVQAGGGREGSWTQFLLKNSEHPFPSVSRRLSFERVSDRIGAE